MEGGSWRAHDAKRPDWLLPSRNREIGGGGVLVVGVLFMRALQFGGSV